MLTVERSGAECDTVITCYAAGNTDETGVGMKKVSSILVSPHIGMRDDMNKQPCDSGVAEPDGFVGDKHRRFSPGTIFSGDEMMVKIAIPPNFH